MKYQITLPENYQKIPLPYFKEWTEALKSGEYQQAKTTLRQGDEYCCLGVLSEKQGRLKYDEEGDDWGDLDCHNGYLGVNNPVYDIFGEDGRFPQGVTVKTDREYHLSLAHLNDRGATFAQICEIIETLYCEAP